jgi:hypothetical protein
MFIITIEFSIFLIPQKETKKYVYFKMEYLNMILFALKKAKTYEND